MQKIGFKLRYGAESFYVDRYWDPLPPVYINGKQIDNVSYNKMFGLPQIYENIPNLNKEIHLMDRVPEVIELAKSGTAKLQYYQLLRSFDEYNLD